MYQSFNLFLRQRWLAQFGPDSLLAPQEVHTDYRTVLAERSQGGGGGGGTPAGPAEPAMRNIHVVIEVRSINKKKTNNHSSARHIANLPQVLAALRNIIVEGVRSKQYRKEGAGDQLVIVPPQ